MSVRPFATCSLAVLVLVACGGGSHEGGAVDPSTDTASPVNGSTAGLPVPDAGGPLASPPAAEPPSPACKRTVHVATSAALGNAIAAARAGDCIVLADGTYTFPAIDVTGTATSPIVVRAANLGKAVVSAGGLDVRGAYVVIEGLHWTSNGRFTFDDCSHCRLTRTRFQPTETADNVDWITVGGKSDSCRIDHNDVGPRTRIGNDVMLAGSGAQTVQHTRIDHNFFHDVHRTSGNGWETIRAGLSGWTFSHAFTTIEQNLFARCDGDPETISIKSSDNVIRYNTMRANAGELVLRHGNGSEVYGNFIFGDGVTNSGGIRVLGGNHEIWNNFIDGVSEAGITLEGGESNDATGNLTDHKQVYGARVVFNTILTVGNSHAINVGGAHPMDPIDSVVANNIAQGPGPLFGLTATSKNIRYAANLVKGVPGVTKTPAEVRVADPMFAKSGDLFKLAAGSPAVDAADPSFSFVSDDIEGQPRIKPDIGADERSSSPAIYGVLTEKDVGPAAP